MARFVSDRGCFKVFALSTSLLSGEDLPCVNALQAVHVYGCCPVLVAVPVHAPCGAAAEARIVPMNLQ